VKDQDRERQGAILRQTQENTQDKLRKTDTRIRQKQAFVCLSRVCLERHTHTSLTLQSQSLTPRHSGQRQRWRQWQRLRHETKKDTRTTQACVVYEDVCVCVDHIVLSCLLSLFIRRQLSACIEQGQDKDNDNDNDKERQRQKQDQNETKIENKSSIRLSACVCLCLPCWLSICLYACLSVSLPLSVCRPAVRRSVCLAICMSVCEFIYLSIVRPSVCLPSVYVSV
jgi:hypothetical protein